MVKEANASTVKVADIVWRKDLYPRFEADPATIQNYAECIDVLPPIEINQRNELIDGYHRWTAHKKKNVADIAVIVTKTVSDADLLKRAITANAKHGLQLSIGDKKRMAVKLYETKESTKEELAELLSVTVRAVSGWVQNIDDARKEEVREKIFSMWLACYTDQEIGDTVEHTQQSINKKIPTLQLLENFPKVVKLSLSYQDADWSPQLYDIWNFKNNANSTKHFGNTHVAIVDNLLYRFTQPFEIVVDPFGGGGSTIDICKKRLRRYWVSDRKPPVERTDIRTHDVVTDGVSGPAQWPDVKLVYLDPPYWKQAAGEYSKDKTDLANMSLDDFTVAMVKIINDYAGKLKPGAHIACIISPTQWPNKDKSINYHDIDMIHGVNAKKLSLVRHIICPYSTEQYNGTQVNIAKERKMDMVISRRLTIWERV